MDLLLHSAASALSFLLTDLPPLLGVFSRPDFQTAILFHSGPISLPWLPSLVASQYASLLAMVTMQSGVGQQQKGDPANAHALLGST